MARVAPRIGLSLVLVLAGIALVGAFPVRTEAGSSLRCGNRLVSDGDAMDEVHRRCGQPTFRSVSTEYVSFDTGAGVAVTRAVAVETWTYNRGPREFVRYLTFRDGRLVHVTEGDYGY